MHIIKGFKLRTVMGKPIIVAEGVAQANFNKMITLNESSAMLWQAVDGKEFTADDLADLLVENYDIDRETAARDAKEIADVWVDVGLVEK